MRTLHFYAMVVYIASLAGIGALFKIPLAFIMAVPIVWLLVLSSIMPYKEHKVERKFPEERFVEGDACEFTYRITGNGYYSVSDEFNSLKGYCKDLCERKIRKKLAHFDLVNFKSIRIYSEDLLGMEYSPKNIHQPAELRIYPRIEYMRKFSIRPRKTRSLLGDYPSRRKGIGLEFADIREYYPGDSMRRINWKATARRNKLMVNEYESERTGDTVILLDVRRFFKSDEEYEKILEASVRAAATITTYLSKTKNRVGLVLLGNTVDWVYPTYGKRALYLILDRLLRVRSGKIARLPFEYGKFIVSRFFPPNSFVILISPLLAWDTDDAVVELLARGYDILVISPSMISDKNDFATRILRAEREVRLRRLRLYARVVDWNIEYPLTAVLKVMK